MYVGLAMRKHVPTITSETLLTKADQMMEENKLWILLVVEDEILKGLFAAVVTLVDGILRIVLVKDSPRVTDDTAGLLAVLRVPGHSPSSWPSPLARPCFLLLNPSCQCTSRD